MGVPATGCSCYWVALSQGVPATTCVQGWVFPSSHAFTYGYRNSHGPSDVDRPLNHPRILKTGQCQLAMSTGRCLLSGLPSVTQAMASNGLHKYFHIFSYFS